MKALRALLTVAPVVAACLCVATTAVQASALMAFWATGAVNQEKLVRFAAATYGLDVSELPSPGEDQTGAEVGTEQLSHAEVLQARVSSNPLLSDRQVAVEKGTDDTHILFQKLQSDTERFDSQRQRFDSHLAELERDIRAQAIHEVRQTLEILQPRQSKELILRMLRDEDVDPEDDVVADVVTIIKAMPQDKLKKTLGEFKTPVEQEELHRILVEIGELDDR